MLKRIFAVIVFLGVLLAIFINRRVETSPDSMTSTPVIVAKVAPANKLIAVAGQPTSPKIAEDKASETLVDNVRAWRTKIPVDKAEEQKIIRAAQNQRDDELEENAAVVMNSQTDGETRWSALFVLSSAGPRAAPYLQKIVTTPFLKPKSESNQELSLRITALSNLDQFAVDGADMRANFQSAMTEASDPTLRMLAIVALQGTQQKHPGKLIRYMDHLLRR